MLLLSWPLLEQLDSIMGLGVRYADIIPYTSVFLDCSFTDILYGLHESLRSSEQEDVRRGLLQNLHHLFVTEKNPNPAIVCLAARTAFDLFQRVSDFPPGSEIIFTAINIPDMAKIARENGLKVVPCDLDLHTMGPKLDLLESLITCRTVAILAAHLFGRWFDMEPVIRIAQKHNLKVVEDCAESFCGFDRLGDPRSDLTLFSFGPIKFFTALGGGVAKVRERSVLEKMEELHDSYATQPSEIYLQKLLKCAAIFLLLNIPTIIKPAMLLTDRLNIDHKSNVVSMLRGFPTDLLRRLRHRPPIALLALLLRRMRSAEEVSPGSYTANGQYIWDRLPDGVGKFGMGAVANNFWLFPVLVENPRLVSLELNRIGIDAYIGASQLNVVQPEFETFLSSSSSSVSVADGGATPLLSEEGALKQKKVFLSPFPETAKFFMDHVMYLPVNRMVSAEYLQKMSDGIAKVINSAAPSSFLLPSNSDSAFFNAKI